MFTWIRNLALRAAIYYEKSRGLIHPTVSDKILAEINDKQ